MAVGEAPWQQLFLPSRGMVIGYADHTPLPVRSSLGVEWELMPRCSLTNWKPQDPWVLKATCVHPPCAYVLTCINHCHTIWFKEPYQEKNLRPVQTVAGFVFCFYRSTD